MTIHAAHCGGERGQVDWIRKADDDNWRNSALFRARRQPTPRGTCHDTKERNEKVTAGVEASQQLSDESQAKRMAHETLQ